MLSIIFKVNPSMKFFNILIKLMNFYEKII